MIQEMKGFLSEFEKLSKGQALTNIKKMEKLAGSDPGRVKIFAKRKSNYDDILQKFNRSQSDFKLNLENSKAATSGDKGDGTRYDSSFMSGNQNGDTGDIPVMQAYNQQEFIDNRNDKIKQLHSDAKEVKDIASQVNKNIYEQDEKLDYVVKKNKEQVVNVQTANQELAQAREITANRNKNIMCWTGLVAVLVIVLSLSIYYMFFK